MILPHYNPLAFLERIAKLYKGEDKAQYIPEPNNRHIKFGDSAELRLDDIVNIGDGAMGQSFKLESPHDTVHVGNILAGLERVIGCPVRIISIVTKPKSNGLQDECLFYFEGLKIPTEDEELKEAGVNVEKMN